MMAAYRIANLNDDQTGKIQELEKSLNVCAIALEPGLKLADLEQDQLADVKKLEEELGVTLIVYQEC
jgi:hypothetical protein